MQTQHTTMTTADGRVLTQQQVDAYDRMRLPAVHSSALHMARKHRRDAAQLAQRGLPGDRFGAARLLWYARNCDNHAEHAAQHAARLGLDLDNTAQGTLFDTEEGGRA